MGKIILNNIEYGIGISNGYNIDITNLVEKDNIVTVIDENVTDEQIPSAKAVYDKLSDLPTDSGSKCYTTLDELGLTADATIQDVIDALSIGDTALLRTDAFTNWSTLFNGIQWGYLKVEKTVNGLCNIELQEVVTPNRRYFGTQSSGKFSSWQNMQASGNSTNYSKSSLSINSWSGYSSGKIYYQSVNGICYITVSDLCILSGEKTNSTQLPAGLVPATDVAQNLIDNNGKIIGRITIAEGNRTLVVKHLSANAGDNASLTFSYPIKTS